MWEAKTSKGRVGVREGLGKAFVGRDQFVHCVVLLYGGVREVVEGRGHSFGLFCLGCCLVGEGAVACCHAHDVARFCKGSSPMRLPIVPSVVNNWTTCPLAPREFHSATVKCRFRTRRHHGSLGDGNACVEGKCLAFLLLARVHREGKLRVDAGVEVDHVVVDVWLRDGSVGGTNVCDEVAERDGVEALSGVVKSRVIYVVDGCCELVACDGGNDEIGIPRFLFDEVGGACCFAGRECSRCVDGIIGQRRVGDVDVGTGQGLEEARDVLCRGPKGKEWP